MRAPNPRAARPSVVARLAAAALLSTATLLSSATASAFQLRHTASGAVVHWPTQHVTVEVDPGVMAALPGAVDAIAASMAGWGAAKKGPTLAISVSPTPSSPAVDGRNVVYYAPDGYPAAGDALAVTLVSFDEATGEIVDADIVLNGRYAFAVLPEDAAPIPGMSPVANDPVSDTATLPHQPPGMQFDLVHVLSHETGHLLGLLDATDETSDVMYLYTSAHDAARREPAIDDIAGVDALYAATPAQASCTVAAAGSAAHFSPDAIFSVLGLVWAGICRRTTRRRIPSRKVAARCM